MNLPTKKKGAVFVAFFLLLYIWWSSVDAAEGLVEIGPAQVGSEYSETVMLTLTRRVQDRFDFTLGYIGDQEWNSCDRPDCEWKSKAQIFVGAEALATDPWSGKFKLGIGPYYFQRQDRIGTSHFRVGLSVEYRHSRRFGLRARHFSNAGSGPNIEVCNDYYCQVNDWNTGQDSWLRAIWYF